MDGTQLEKYVEAFLVCRKRLDDLEAEYEAKKKSLVELKERLEGWFGEFLTATGQVTAVTPHGTIHWNTRYTAVLEDADAFMRHVIGTGEYELMERRASATAAQEYAKANGTLPPGVRLNSKRSIGVNKPGARAKSAAVTAAVNGAIQ
jgi:hypothetical protein